MSLKLNKFIKTVVVCSEEKRYALLKVIESLGKTNYTMLMNVIMPPEMSKRHISSDFAFHIRKLRIYGVITKDPQTDAYTLTSLGKEVMKMLHKYQEKYITDDESSLCNNDSENNHDYVKICRKCGFIQKELLVQCNTKEKEGSSV